MPRKITDEQRQEAWKMYNDNYSIINIARKIGASYFSAWVMTEGRKKGFKNYSEYQEHLAVQKGFKNLSKYQEHLIVQKGFKNYSEYQEHLAVQRQKRYNNKKLSELINRRLKELKMNQSWLAQGLGVSRQMASNYFHGKSIPFNKVLKKLSSVLKIEKSRLEDIVERFEED